MQKLWDEHGYQWRWGCELEFTLLTPEKALEEIKSIKDDPVNQGLYPEYDVLEESYKAALTAADQPDIYLYTIEQARNWFTSHPDSNQFMQDTGWTHDLVTEHLREIEENLYSDDPEVSHRARQNIFLLHLHINNFDEGGLRDLIEPRFGDYELGLGWYDMMGPEVRTKIIDDPLELIGRYHKFLSVLTRQAARFGLVPDMTYSSPPQFHLSIWRKDDNKNMMLMQDAESVDFCERAARGYYELISSAPFLVQDDDHRQRYIQMAFSAGTTREDYIRQESDNWEIRRPQYHGITHAARHIMAVMSGMAFGCLYPDYYKNMVECQNVLSVYVRLHPVVKGKFGQHISGLCAALEHASINTDGYLRPDEDTIRHYLGRLQDEIGKSNLSAFKCTFEINGQESTLDLNHPVGWMEMLKRIKICPDRTIDMGILADEEEIVEAFAALEITGFKPAIKIGADDIDCSPHNTELLMDLLRHSDVGTVMFTPYEMSELYSHYSRQSDATLHRIAEYHVRLLEKILPEREDEEKLFRDFYDELYIDPTCDMDIGVSFLSYLIASIEHQLPFERDAFQTIPVYFKTLRDHFKDAAENRAQDLESMDPRPEATIHALRSCSAHMYKRPFDLVPASQDFFAHFMSLIANGKMIAKEGLSDITIPRVAFASTMSLYRNFSLMLMDPAYNNTEIINGMGTLYREADNHFATLANEHQIEKKDAATQAVYNACRNHIKSTMRSLFKWSSMGLGNGVFQEFPALPAPATPGTPKERPAQMAGPL